MSKKQPRGLGRGLSALMADVATAPASEPAETAEISRGGQQSIPIEKVFPNPDQPRRTFTQEDLDDLTASIREKGVIQPLIVRPRAKAAGTYEIVAGERRWRAAQAAQRHEVPVLIREYTDTEALEVAIIENIQRADLNPVEEASGYRELMDRFGHTQEKMAEALGKSRSHIANMLRLLNLPEDVRDLLKSGALATGHARALITSDNASELAAQIVAKGLTVRDAERLAKSEKAPTKPKSAPKAKKDADTIALENDLSATLKMSVSINHAAGSEHGSVTIKYSSLDELDDLCQKLGS
ncbi:MAG: chromosome partitioning protein ParB [Rhodobacterales bacterium]|nr:MAG: chromosome partitioning protein ParB [Rhodobacterales bacterium]